ncbi:MAG TPA: sigma factor-like helix-turn-helix DNA-binding protein, partial [Candidatus Paceibacterota bacterium]|nr:sigma factor-like helix-turn-helix DNA-binding protein [Candidatus Paceibacterota bacterium]
FFNKLVGKGFTLLERKIIYLYYYENLTMGLIGEIVNMSESRVSQLHGDLLLKLKDKISKNPNYFSNDIYEFIKTSSKN